jgi:hypothetical protein
VVLAEAVADTAARAASVMIFFMFVPSWLDVHILGGTPVSTLSPGG